MGRTPNFLFLPGISGRWLSEGLWLEGECELSLRQEKQSTKINFLGLVTARWGGGLPHKRVVAEKFVPSLEGLSSLGFEGRNLGCLRNFAGMSWAPGGVQKVCVQEKFVRIFRSLTQRIF